MPHPGLSAVVGRWRTEGRVLDPEPVPVVGTASTERMVLRIGDDGVWRFAGSAAVAPAARSGEAPTGGAVRATLMVAPDGASMRALWERADDGTFWRRGWTSGSAG